MFWLKPLLLNILIYNHIKMWQLVLNRFYSQQITLMYIDFFATIWQ